MDESRWSNSAEEYRTIQGLARDGKYREALDRAQRTILTGQVGRRNAARLHSLVCWLLSQPLGRPGPMAVMHGEEAVRLAQLVHDSWIKCEAQARLMQTLLHTGDLFRAERCYQTIVDEVASNAGALTGGTAGLRLLEAQLLHARGAARQALAVSADAERPGDQSAALVLGPVRTLRLHLLLSLSELPEAEGLLALGQPDQEPYLLLEWDWLRAWALVLRGREEAAEQLLDLVQLRADGLHNGSLDARCLAIRALAAERRGADGWARELAYQAVQRAINTGRKTWVRQLRLQLAHLV